MKNEWKWWSAFGVISVLVLGVLTGFRFGELTIHRYDTPFTIHAVRAILYLTALLGTVRNLYLLIELFTARYKVLALIVAIINPIVALMLIILVYSDAQAIIAFQKIYPGVNLLQQLTVTTILMGMVVVLVVVEFRVLKKLGALLNGTGKSDEHSAGIQ